MSTENIAAMVPTPAGLIVTFRTRNGQTLSYLYDAEDGEQIQAGEDPSGFTGTRLG